MDNRQQGLYFLNNYMNLCMAKVQYPGELKASAKVADEEASGRRMQSGQRIIRLDVIHSKVNLDLLSRLERRKT